MDGRRKGDWTILVPCPRREPNWSRRAKRQFPDVSELLSEHSLRQAVGKLAGTETQLLEKDSKKLMCRYIESDTNQKLLEELRNDIGKIIWYKAIWRCQTVEYMLISHG